MFRCRNCSASFSLKTAIWRCLDCGGLLDVIPSAFFERNRLINRPATLWRYAEAIPTCDSGSQVSLGEPMTPLIPFNIDGAELLLKMDYLLPTGSFKDRGAAVLISWLKGLGIRQIVEDSSGNAGSSIAAYCARAGIDCTIFVPDTTSAAKLHQIRSTGASVRMIQGGRQAAADACLNAAGSVFYGSHVWQPLFFQGTKTIAFEIWEQLGFEAPDDLILPVGNGSLLLGVSIGFNELLDAGFIQRRPRLIGVQSVACDPLVQTWINQSDHPVIQGHNATIAEGIAVPSPIRGKQILDAITESKGTMLSVNDQMIRTALRSVCKAGIFIEPTSAAAIAGCREWLRSGQSGERIVIPLTGSGLKCPDTVMKLIIDDEE